MTFCLGMRLQEGLVAIADTRVTSGSEYIMARKVTCYEVAGGAFFVMTSGLRSVRDKALTYFNEYIEEMETPFERVFQVVNAFSSQVRRVANEDKQALESNGTHFTINVLIGGQFLADKEHKLYQIYPEANWVDVGPGTPYHIIGARGYGKPILDRTLKFEDSMRFALKVGSLAFDSTRISAADVGFPVDAVLYYKDSYQLIEHRYYQKDFQEMSDYWQERLRKSIAQLEPAWLNDIMEKKPTALSAEELSQVRKMTH